MRADYVLPSANLRVLDSGMHRPLASDEKPVTDHFLVWIDLQAATSD